MQKKSAIVTQISKLAKMLFFLPIFSLCSFVVAKENTSGHEKVVAITGVTKGLGLALAKEFADLGFKVAGCGRSQDLILQLQKEFGQEHLFSSIDITDDFAVASWADEVEQKFGSVDILINNAGLINSPSPLWEISYAEFTNVLNTNVVGTFNTLKYFTPLMIRQRKGLIVNISSGWGQEGEKMFAPYCASKFAIEGLTQSFAEELPKGLAVISLDPGVFNTELLKKAYQEEAAKYPSPEKRAKAIAACITKLGSKDNGKTAVVP